MFASGFSQFRVPLFLPLSCEKNGLFNRSKSEDVTWSCYTPICAVVLFKHVLNKTIQFICYIRLTSLFLFWSSLADRLGATSSAFGSGGFDHGCKTGTSANDLAPGVAFVVGWEIGTVASLVVVRDLRTPAFLASAWRTGAAIPLAGSLSGTQTSVVWRIICADGPSSLVTGMGVPYNATTEGLSM